MVYGEVGKLSLEVTVAKKHDQPLVTPFKCDQPTLAYIMYTIIFTLFTRMNTKKTGYVNQVYLIQLWLVLHLGTRQQLILQLVNFFYINNLKTKLYNKAIHMFLHHQCVLYIDYSGSS